MHIFDSQSQLIYITVLTDKPFLVIAGNVMPDCSISIKVVEHGNAGLIMLSLHLELPVVWLWLPCSSCLTPISFNKVKLHHIMILLIAFTCHFTISTSQPYI